MPTFPPTAQRLIFSFFLFLTYFHIAEASSFLESSVKDPTGARPLGMGGAFVGSASGPEAVFYNPAGLGDIGFNLIQGNIDINQFFFDLNDYQFITLGSFGYGQWNRRDRTGREVRISSWGYGNLGRRGGWGVSYKTIQDKTVPGATQAGNSMDIGYLQLIAPDLLFGALVQDVFKNNVALRSSLRVGFAYTPGGEEIQYLVEGDVRGLRDPAGPEVRMHYGVETPLTKTFVGRAGWDAGRYTLGVTMQLPFVAVDYALAADLIHGEETMRTVGVRFGGTL